jgi:anti-sigma-K factor RskA
MGAEALHELTAAYALDALDPGERQSYEQHLSGCSQCQEELAELSGAAGALAYAVEPGDPPPALRERILDAARAERPNVVPLRPRWATPVAAVAAVAACAAVGLGIWNISLHNRLSGSSEALQRVPVSGASGSVVLGSGGAGALVLSDLSSAPVGKTYEAWVIKGDVATRAGLFRGGQTSTYVRLSKPVPSGAIVAVTIEPAGGSAQPTGKPFIVSTAV